MTSTDGTGVKKKCPYMEKCYRRNPIHFNEMSHPHLDKLLVNQLDGNITIPAHLDFECSDRSHLLDQLKILQMILRRERDKNSSSSQTNQARSKEAAASTATKNVDLLEKVERHKKATSLKRQEKLLEMDAKAEALAKESSKGRSSDTEDNGISKMRSELNELKLALEKSDDQSSQSKKRNYPSTSQNDSVAKKSRTACDSTSSSGTSSADKYSQESLSGDRSSDSFGKTSLFDIYQSCNSRASREEVRQKTIKMMRQHGYEVPVVEPGDFAIKYALSAPYHLFFSRIQSSKETYDQQFSITFPEILDKSLGEIVSSLHFNFMVDVGWLCLQYLLAGQSTDMLIFLGERVDEEKLPPNIKTMNVEMPSRFGCHHSKIMVLRYKDNGLRIVVSTANLYSDDWENRTQGLWISPHLPPLPSSANTGDGESPTGFRKDFERYLSKYRQPALAEWSSAIRRADFSEVNVFFVASVPGSHKSADMDLWGHRKLAQVLSKHATLPADAPQWPIVAQSSSIGSLGPNYESWLLKEIVPAMSRETARGLKSHPNFQFIYPSLDNYKRSFDCRSGSCCLPYTLQTHSKQPWIEAYLYQWKASRTARDRAMPHIKSYTRFSPDWKKISWFVLTSANLSKAAWGTSRASNYIMSYEAGVIFLPKLITKTDTFPVQEEDPETPAVPVFPIMYDLPPTRYDSGDKPFVMEFLSE